MKFKSLFFLLLVGFSGCMVGPDFCPPEVSVYDEWLPCDNPLITCNSPPPCEWWEVFEDPTLTYLLSVAKEQNLPLQAAGMRILQARAERGIAIGEFFPQLQELIGNAERIHISKNAPNTFAGDRQYWDFISGLQASWELDFWGRFRRGIESADETLLATIADYQDVLILLLSEVASTYLTIRTFEERIGIIKQNIAIQERSLEIVEARWRAGVVTELDVQQARTLVYDTRSRLPLLENDLTTVQDALAVLLGLTPDHLICYLDEPGPIPIPAKELGVGIPAELLARRPDVRSQFHKAAAQSARIGIAVSDLLPRISINGFIGLESSTSSTKLGNGGIFNSDSITFFYGPSFAWPILNYGRLTNRVRAERALFYQTVLDYQNSVLVAYQEAEDGLSAYIYFHEQVDELDESVKASKRAAELARTQYVEGIADYTRVLETERSKLEADEQLAIANGNIALSVVALYRALGGGWECADELTTCR
ncbi:MAG: Toluene efflux pump outer membrane protein TtgI [Chlamydiae bacterium]|nr:Toluene efflux pump outer membrane protein TtgI [Chlamydiota bacterium]